jgi:oxalate decarboxylase
MVVAKGSSRVVKSRRRQVSLLDWLTHTPPELVAQHLNIDASVVRQFPNNAPGLMPV